MDGRAYGPALGVAASAFAVACCAGLPAIGALLGGIALAGIIGVAGGVLALAVLGVGAILLARARHRRESCKPSARGPTP